MKHHQELLSGGHVTDAYGQGESAAAEQPETSEGQWRSAAKANGLLPSDAPLSDYGPATVASGLTPTAAVGHPHESEGQASHAVKASLQLPSDSPPTSAGSHAQLVDKTNERVPSADAYTIALIRDLHRQRCYVMEQRKRADLALGAYLRNQLGWAPGLSKAESEAISKHAVEMIESGEKEIILLSGRKLHMRTKPPRLDDPVYIETRDIIHASIQARAPFDTIEKSVTKRMEKLAETLPVWEYFGKGVRGFSTRSLATLVGEAGDLANYATHSKLWKRMGVAVMGDVRQGGLTKAASKEEWIAHGYNRKRRAHLYVIGDSLIKAAGEYYQVYLDRKDYERRRAEAFGLIVAPSAKIPKKRAAEFMSHGHIHKRSQRYMEKRLLRNLWRAWRNERKANLNMP